MWREHKLNVGGIAGSSYGSIRDCRVQGGVVHGSNAGGVSGLISAGEIMGCCNSADVYGMCYTGGICGWNAAMTYLQMSECVNEGDRTWVFRDEWEYEAICRWDYRVYIKRNYD